MKTCPECKKVYFSHRHDCLPAYKVYVQIDDTWHHAGQIYADSAKEAARKGTREVDTFFDFTFPIASKAWTVAVEVIDPEGHKWRFDVQGEIVPAYSVTKRGQE